MKITGSTTVRNVFSKIKMVITKMTPTFRSEIANVTYGLSSGNVGRILKVGGR